MNKIEKLIKELCPNGVEWKKLGEIGSFYGGLSGKTKEDFVNGNAIFITYKNIYSNPKLYMNPIDKVHISKNEKQNIIEYGDVLFTGSSETPDECGISSVVSEKPKENMYLNSFCFGFRLNDKSVYNIGFLSHLFRSNEIRAQIAKTASGVTRFNISKKLFANLLIPLPPLPIQTEIVRILDKFVEQQEQLERLIELRKKQYEYYREELLKPKEGEVWETKRLGDIGKIFIGKKPNEILDKGTFEYINAGTTCSGYSETYNFEEDTITTPSRGEGGIGFVGYQKKRFWCGPLCYAIKTSENNKFIYHYLTLHNKLILDLKCEGGVPALNRKDLITIEIQVPPVAVQEKIVHTLDSFETTITTLTTALELSKKRYEYYRDKMMRF